MIVVATIVGVLAAVAAVLSVRRDGRRPAWWIVPLAAVASLVFFSLAVVVVGGLGSGDPMLGPSLAVAELGAPTVWVVVAVGAAIGGVGLAVPGTARSTRR